MSRSRIFWSSFVLLFTCFLSTLKCEIDLNHDPKQDGRESSMIFYHDLKGAPYTVTYDSRSFFINNKRTLLLGGSIHYPRLSPGQWVDILTKAKNDGLNHVQIYVFWNIHEPAYNFDGNHTYHMGGRANLTGFLQTAQDVGLFVNLRIGPYVCAYVT